MCVLALLCAQWCPSVFISLYGTVIPCVSLGVGIAEITDRGETMKIEILINEGTK